LLSKFSANSTRSRSDAVRTLKTHLASHFIAERLSGQSAYPKNTTNLPG